MLEINQKHKYESFKMTHTYISYLFQAILNKKKYSGRFEQRFDTEFIIFETFEIAVRVSQQF